MKKYPKINTIFKRCLEPRNPHRGKLIDGDWSRPEFDLLQNIPWEATEKVDGTNIRVSWDGAQVQFAGKTEESQIPPKLLTRLNELFTADKFKRLEMVPMVIFGEGYGNKIRKAGRDYIPDGVDFVTFDVWCGDLWLETGNVIDIATNLGVEHVPYIPFVTLHDALGLAEDGIQSKQGCAKNAEGLVLRAPLGMLTRRGSRIITKIKTKDFTRGMITIDEHEAILKAKEIAPREQ